MVSDLNKQIGSASTAGIAYDYRNLPLEVNLPSGAKEQYGYDCAGQRISKTLAGSGASSSPGTTDSGARRNLFYLRDHLGNTRVGWTIPERQ